MKDILAFFQSQMTPPVSYGLFHIVSVILCVIITTLIIILFKDCKDKTFRRIALICWLIMLCFEIYKQITLGSSYDDNGVYFSLAWYIFPFQLCSTPLYILPFVAFMKDGKVRDYFISFISTFALFGGLVVFIYPNDVFCEFTGINVQTMVHHGLQLVTGIFFAVYQRKKLNFKYFLKSIPVFIVLVIIALILNETIYTCLVNNGIDMSLGANVFNMFYISSHFPNHLPILSTIYASLPYLVFLLIYVFGFCLASIIVFYAIVGSIKLATIIKKLIKK